LHDKFTNQIISVNFNTDINVWNQEDQEFPSTVIHGHQNTIKKIVLLNKKLVISVDLDGRILSWDLKSG